MSAVVVIGGSTASGKSALALRLAAATGGVIVNADSQQLFRDLPTLTARPTPAETRAVPHQLYGVLVADEVPSAGRWLDIVVPLLDDLREAGRPAIVTGGSALYLEALLYGLVELPSVPQDLRDDLRHEAQSAASEALHERLAAVDPVMADRLRPSDRQRVLRALEVVLATGRSLADWQAAAPSRRRALPQAIGLALLPDAATIATRVESRLDAMLAGGAVDEVEALVRQEPGWRSLPIAKVHGCREIAAMLAGSMTAASARLSIAVQVRQYAKRQRTFFRNRLSVLEALGTVGETPELVPLLVERLRSRE